jgi:hypothetical protein
MLHTARNREHFAKPRTAHGFTGHTDIDISLEIHEKNIFIKILGSPQDQHDSLNENTVCLAVCYQVITTLPDWPLAIVSNAVWKSR